MKKKVTLHIDSTFDKNGDEQRMQFFTEGVMKAHAHSYTYEYDETEIFGAQEPIRGLIEVGEDYVTRTVSGEENYVMQFREGHEERVIYHTPHGSFSTDIYTKSLHCDLEEGIGKVSIVYEIVFAQTESMLNAIDIQIKETSQ